MRFELFVADRYLRSKKQTGFVSFIAWISVAGVALGTAVLIIVLSVMNGFEHEVRARIVGTNAALIVLRHDRDSISDPEAVAEKVAQVPQVTGVSPMVYGKGLLKAGDRSDGVIVKGVDLAREREVTTITDQVTPPLKTLKADPGGSPAMILGRNVADRLRASVGDEVVLANPFTFTTTITGPRVKMSKFRVAGIFTSGLYEYDASLVFIDLPEAQKFFNMGTEATGLQIKLADMFAAPEMENKVLEALGGFPYRINSWIDLNENLFLWMKLEKFGMSVILLLIVVIAAFNIVGVLVMLVMENKREIGVLKSMGATDGDVMRIFMTTGAEIGFLGVLLGSLLGVIGTFLLRRYPLDLPGDVYFLTSLPVLLLWRDVLMVAGVVFILAWIATLYPSWKAARLDPVQAIREA